MIRLLIILLIIYLFIRFYKHMSPIDSSRGTRGSGIFDSQPRNNNADTTKRFDDIEEAEFVEINEDSKSSSDASKDHTDQPDSAGEKYK